MESRIYEDRRTLLVLSAGIILEVQSVQTELFITAQNRCISIAHSRYQAVSNRNGYLMFIGPCIIVIAEE